MNLSTYVRLCNVICKTVSTSLITVNGCVPFMRTTSRSENVIGPCLDVTTRYQLNHKRVLIDS